MKAVSYTHLDVYKRQIKFRLILPHTPGFRQEQLPAPVCSHSPECNGCPYYAFEYLAPHLDGLEISLNKLNDLAALLATLDEVQEAAFDGFLRM